MYVNIRTAAQELHVSETQVRRLIKAKKLKAVNVGMGTKRKSYRIKKEDISALK